MLGTIKHVFSNAIADGTNTNIVRPSDWNSGHNVTLSLQSNDYPVFSAGLNTAYLSSVVFSNSNGVSFGLNGSTVTATVGTNYAGVGETVGTVAGTDLGLTVNTDGVSIAYPKWISTARASTDAVGLNTAQTAVTWTVNSSGISIDAGAYLTTARRSTDAVGLNTALTANGVAWTVNSSGISLNVPAFLTTARASTDAIGLNTAQTNVTWTVNSSGLSFNAGGYAGTGFTSTTTAGTDVKATHNTAGLSMAVPAYLTALNGQTTQSAIKAFGASNIGNTAGNTGVSTGIDWVIAGTNNITVSESTVGGGPNTLWLSAPGGAVPTVNWWNNISANAAMEGLTFISSSQLLVWPIAPDPFPGNMTVSTMGLQLSYSHTNTSASTQAQSSTFSIGFYTLNGNTLSLVNSASTTWGFNAASDMSSNYNGGRHLTFHSSLFSSSPVFSNTNYWIGLIYATGGSSISAVSYLRMPFAGGLFQLSGTIGKSIVTAASMGAYPFHAGRYTAATGAFPASIAHSDLNRVIGGVSGQPLAIYFNNQTSAF